MTTIPLTISDNFFSSPEVIKNLGLNIEYEINDNLTFPGVRSKCLSEIHFPLFEYINRKVLGLFFEDYLNIGYHTRLYFQYIKDYQGTGWVHQDHSLFTYIIYLTEETTLNCGTSFFELKNNNLWPYENLHKWQYLLNEVKNFHTNKKMSEELQKEKNLMVKNNLTKILDIKDKFNRLVCFPAEIFHCANHLGDGNSSRLTLIGFVEKVSSSDLPIIRSKRTVMI